MNTSNQTSSLELNRRTQEILMLTMALQAMGGGGSKRETLRFIERRGWYVTCRSDFEQTENGNEFRFENSLAWARKDGVGYGLLSDKHRDYWRLLEKGSELVIVAKEKFQSGAWDVARCYLWSEELRRLYCPHYEPSERDWHRSEEGYVLGPITIMRFEMA